MKQLTIWSAMAGLAAALFSGCTTEPVSPAEETNLQSPLEDISLQEDFLVFSSDEALEAAVQHLRNLKDDEFANWEASLGFQSMRSLYQQALQEEEAYLAQGEGNENPGHSTFVNTYRDLFAFTTEGEVDLNTFWSDVAAVLNQAGFVQVGDVLYQYSATKLKAYPLSSNPDFERLKRVFALNENDPNLFSSTVEYLPVGNFSTKTENGRFYFYDECSSWWGVKQINGKLRLTKVEVPQYTTFPCGSISCSLGGLDGPDPQTPCEGGTCRIQTGTKFRSTLTVNVKRRDLGALQSSDLLVDGSYDYNGASRDFEDTCHCAKFKTTVFSNLGNAPVNVTNLAFTMGEANGLVCHINFN